MRFLGSKHSSTSCLSEGFTSTFDAIKSASRAGFLIPLAAESISLLTEGRSDASASVCESIALQ